MSRWDTYFLDQCVLAARMSKDPSTRVGAVIVGPDRDVRATGFNGFPRGVEDAPERLLDRDTKLQLVVHAELNALMNAARVGVPTKGCTMYIAAVDASGAVWGGPPCTRCTVHVIQAGITSVVAHPAVAIPERWKADLERSRGLLCECGVHYREVNDPTNGH